MSGRAGADARPGDTMVGLWLEDRRPRLRHDLPAPDPLPGEALVQVRRAGICNTDLELVRGYYPFTGVLGHEFVGEVVGVAAGEPRGGTVGTGGTGAGTGRRTDRGGATGGEAATAAGVPEEWAGRRVVGEINAVCGSCPTCRAGRATHCENRTVLGIVGRDGAFAEYLTLPVACLHEVPAGLSDDEAVFTEPLAAALQVQEQVEVTDGDRVVVVGDGKLGLLVARSLAPTGCALTVVGRHPGKLELVVGAATTTTRPEELDGRSFDLAVECTGNPGGFATALDLLRPRGTLVMKSTYAGDLTVDAAAVVVDEIRLVGSRCGPFAPALERLASGAVRVDDLVTARFPLARAADALREAARPGRLKVLLDVD